MKRHVFPFLDGVRGLAAFFVLTRHTQDYWHFFFYRSYLAVDLFFVMSGFVIAQAYETRLATGALRKRDFLVARLIRLYPVYFVSVLLSGGLLLVGWQPGAVHEPVGRLIGCVTASLLFLPSVLEGKEDLYPLNGAYWSLMFELLVNTLYVGSRNLLSDRVLKGMILLSGVGLVWVGYVKGGLDVGFYWQWFDLMGGALRASFGFFFGLWLWRADINLSRTFGSLPQWLIFPAVATILSLPKFSHWNGPIDLACVFVLFPACIVVGGQKRQEGRGVHMLLTLGAISYPLYVLHDPLAKIVEKAWGLANLFAPWSGIGLLLLLSVFSLAVDRFYDRPVRQRATALFLGIGRR